MSIITRLDCQRQLIRQIVNGGQHVVYGYLRAKNSGTAKAGTPYYIGITSTPWRPYQRHMRGGIRRRAHDVPVPKDTALVRVFGVFNTREDAMAREKVLIARYGKKSLDLGGILLNRTDGGEGVVGTPRTKGQLAVLDERMRVAAEKMGVDPCMYLALPTTARRAMQTRFANGHRGEALVAGLTGEISLLEIRTAHRFNLDPEVWHKLTNTERTRVHARYRYGYRGAALLGNRMDTAAGGLGVAPETWKALTSKERDRVRARHKRGKRGADLLAGIAA